MTPEYLVALSGLAVAVIGAIGGLINSMTKKRAQFGDEDKLRLDEYDLWRPKVMRWAADMRAKLAEHVEPTEIPPFPKLGEKASSEKL